MAMIATEPLAARAIELGRQFVDAKPFPHAVFTDLLSLDPATPFPGPEWPHWQHHGDHYQQAKAHCSDWSAIPEPWNRVILELSTPPVLDFLESLTGIDKLIPDPYLVGGGLHRSGQGGHLAPHTDFHIYEDLGLFRRVNLLLYLNPESSRDSGGELALFAEGQEEPAVLVPPRFGTCAVFATDDRSVHGVRAVGTNQERRSIALYYYTSDPPRRFSGDHSTHWRSHGTGSRARLLAYQALMKASRLFSMAAHLANPHHGLRALREKLVRNDDH